MLTKAGEHGLLRSPACKPVLVAYLPTSTFAAIPVYVLWSEADHRARKTPTSYPPSIRWRWASRILYARYAGIFPGACPIYKIGYMSNPGSPRACSLQTVRTSGFTGLACLQYLADSSGLQLGSFGYHPVLQIVPQRDRQA